MIKEQELISLDDMFSVDNIQLALDHYKVIDDPKLRAEYISEIIEHVIHSEYISSLHTENENVQNMGNSYHVLYQKPTPTIFNKLFRTKPKWHIIAYTRLLTSSPGDETEEARVLQYIVYYIVEFYLVKLKDFTGVPRNFYPHSFGY